MRILLCSVGLKTVSVAAQGLLAEYVGRVGRYIPCEHQRFASEESLLAAVEKKTGRTASFLVATDSRGEQLTSEGLAEVFRRQQDAGVQQLVLAVGPADGWSAAALKRANLKIAFGRITLPHELAAVVLAEQTYRAMTILAGHPYHHGHAG